MKKLEKYKIAPHAKFVKFKVKHFVEIPTIRHDKAVKYKEIFRPRQESMGIYSHFHALSFTYLLT